MSIGLPWAYGPSTAHMMHFIGNGRWVSDCSYAMVREWHRINWTSDTMPLTPWCSWCRSRARERAEAMYLAGVLDGLDFVRPQ